MPLFLLHHRHHCDALNRLEILMIHGNQRKIPLTRRRSDPGICCRNRPSGQSTCGDNIGPMDASPFVGKNGRTEIHVLEQLCRPLRSPQILPGPQQELRMRHERDHQLIASSDAHTTGMQSMSRFKQDRHHFGVEQENLHLTVWDSAGSWRRSSRIRTRKVSASSGWSRSLYGKDFTAGFTAGLGAILSGRDLGSRISFAMSLV